MSEQRVRVANQILYTTPLSGTFYYAVTYRDQYAVFVIVGRTYWLVGFYTDKGYFQMLWEEHRLYMDDPQAVLTGFDGNHGRISRAQIEQTKLGEHWVRNGFGGIRDYMGPSQRPEPEEFRPGLGRFVIMIMESKYKEIFHRCCKSMTRFQHKRLGDEGADHQVHNWNSNCKTVMPRIVEGHASEEEVEETMLILRELYIFAIDACQLGFFSHTPLPPLPRTDTWEPIDNGSGDPRVRRPDLSSRRGRGAVQQPRMSPSMARMRDQRIKSGPRGGAAGGNPDTPSWFTNWNQGDDNENQCTLVVSGARKMGLDVIEKKLFLKNSPKETQTKSSSSIEDANTTNSFKNQKSIGIVEDGSKSNKSSSSIRSGNSSKNFNTNSSSKDGSGTNSFKNQKSIGIVEDGSKSNKSSSSIRSGNSSKNFNTNSSSKDGSGTNSFKNQKSIGIVEDGSKSNKSSSSIRSGNSSKNFNTNSSSKGGSGTNSFKNQKSIGIVEDGSKSNKSSSSIRSGNSSKNFNTNSSSKDGSGTNSFKNQKSIGIVEDGSKSNKSSSSIRSGNSIKNFNTNSSSKDGSGTNSFKNQKSIGIVEDGSKSNKSSSSIKSGNSSKNFNTNSSSKDGSGTNSFKNQKSIGIVEDGSKSNKSSSSIRSGNSSKNFDTNSSSKDGSGTNSFKTQKSIGIVEDGSKSNKSSSSIKSGNSSKNFNTNSSSKDGSGTNSFKNQKSIGIVEDGSKSNKSSSSIRSGNSSKNFDTNSSSKDGSGTNSFKTQKSIGIVEDGSKSNKSSSNIKSGNSSKNFNTNSSSKDGSGTNSFKTQKSIGIVEDDSKNKKSSSSIRNGNSSKNFDTNSSSKDGSGTNTCKSKKASTNMTEDASSTQSSNMVLENDIQELQGPNFLSDSNINRFFHYLSDMVGGGASIQFFDVSTTHLIAHCPFVPHGGFDLTTLDIGLFAVNDNEDHESVGGTHWSLLVFDGTRQPPRFVHHDSSGGRNIEAANRLAASLQLLYPGMEELVVQARTPQQNNGWNCGVHVMAMARSILRWWLEGAVGSWLDRLLVEVDSERVSQLRADFVRLLIGEIVFQDLI